MPNSRKLQVLIIALIIAFLPSLVNAAHSGKIYLQVEQNGEAWYVSPADNNRYYLGRPDDAFDIMRNLGLGITNANIAEIPIGLVDSPGNDDDNDGLLNDLEIAIGTDVANPDTDEDDFSDKSEILNWFNPNGPGELTVNTGLINSLKGKILLQVEKNGEAWYLNPADSKRYFLGRPQNAFDIMRTLGVGISDSNLAVIPSNYVKSDFKVASHYELEAPSSWSIAQSVTDDEKYEGKTIIHDVKIQPSTASGYLEIFVLEDNKDLTLNSFEVSSVKNAKKDSTTDFLLGIKPGKKQRFTYSTSFTSKDIQISKGADLYVDIMISTKKFIHLHMMIYNESDIEIYEKYLDTIVKDLKIVY
ncbi:hypothetical protein HQ571_00685 [Candidatus Kuenenbacteria bacterium]|nr:hypothetical protein [Candidatus Kuenenbacteria bacterium]